FINIDKWNALPPAYKSLVRTASSMANEGMQAKYDAANPAALKRPVASGAQLRPCPQPVMDASLRAALDVYAEVSKTNTDFKKVWEALLAFRNDEYLWWQVAELTYDNYLVRNRTRTGLRSGPRASSRPAQAGPANFSRMRDWHCDSRYTSAGRPTISIAPSVVTHRSGLAKSQVPGNWRRKT